MREAPVKALEFTGIAKDCENDSRATIELDEANLRQLQRNARRPPDFELHAVDSRPESPARKICVV